MWKKYTSGNADFRREMLPEDIVLSHPRFLREWWLCIYPLLVIIGVCLSSLIGPDEIERERQWYWISGRNIVNWWFAYHGRIIWDMLFFVVILLQLHVCFDHDNVLPLNERDSNINNEKRIFKTVAKEYSVKFLVVELTLWVCFLFIDHLFVWTGGSCDVKDTYSSEICRSLGGEWKGGFDISGHFCFLTNLSLVIWQEMQNLLMSAKVKAVVWTKMQIFSQWLILIVLLIWINVLSITATYYHSAAEKFLGCLMGYSSVFVLYFGIPRISTLNKLLYKQL